MPDPVSPPPPPASPPPPPASPPPPPAPAAWHTSLDADLQAYVTKNGLAAMDPVAAFTAAAKSHEGLQQHFGVPADRIVRLPDGENPDGWKAVWQRLGTPDAADKYDFADIRGPNNTDPDADVMAGVRDIAFKLGLPQSFAKALAGEMLNRFVAESTAEAADLAARVAQSQASLKQNWAQNFDANMFVATQAMKAFGLTDAQVEAAKNSPTGAATLETWRQIGARIGEDKFVQGGNNGGPQNVPMTKADAQAKLDDLKGDKEWMARWSAGGSAERREFERLTQMAAGVDAGGNVLA